jgi:drug/metabolite transporter (DMT)-like permease
VGWGLLLAFFAAVCTAGATILQAIGARHARHFRAIDPRLLLSVIRSLAYVLGLVLLIMSFGLTLVALRNTALFVVQALAAASIALVAAVSAVVFRTRLHRVEWTAVVAVCVGVALLVITQQPSTATNLPPIGPWALLFAAIGIAIVALTATRALSGAAMPSLLAGLAYGDAAVGSRVVARLDGSLTAMLANPATYAIVVSGLIGTLLYATALQRGSVTAVFGLSTVGQTIGPAVTGWLILGDSVHRGMAPYAGVGFALAFLGALVLGRHAHPDQIMSGVALPALPDCDDDRDTAGETTPSSLGAVWRAQILAVVRTVKCFVEAQWRKIPWAQALQPIRVPDNDESKPVPGQAQGRSVGPDRHDDGSTMSAQIQLIPASAIRRQPWETD